MPKQKRSKGNNGSTNGKHIVKGRRLWVLMWNPQGIATRFFPLNSSRPLKTVPSINPGKGLWESLLDTNVRVLKIGECNPDAFRGRQGVIGIFNVSRSGDLKNIHKAIFKAASITQ